MKEYTCRRLRDIYSTLKLILLWLCSLALLIELLLELTKLLWWTVLLVAECRVVLLSQFPDSSKTKLVNFPFQTGKSSGDFTLVDVVLPTNCYQTCLKASTCWLPILLFFFLIVTCWDKYCILFYWILYMIWLTTYLNLCIFFHSLYQGLVNLAH